MENSVYIPITLALHDIFLYATNSLHPLISPCMVCVGDIQLCQAADKNKDQTYFLSTLDQKQLQRVLFPVGSLMKAKVKRIANMEGLHDVAARKEVSQLAHLSLSCTLPMLRRWCKFRSCTI